MADSAHAGGPTNEGKARGAVVFNIGMFKTWQGIVELVLRVAAVVLSFCALIAGSVAEDEADVDNSGGTGGKTMDVAGWLVFVGASAALTEAFRIGFRLVNFYVFNIRFGLVLLIDLIINIVIAVAYFTAGVPLSVYAKDWDDLGDENRALRSDADDAAEAAEAASAFAFLGMFAFIFLAVWVTLFWLFKWNKNIEKYTLTDSGGRGDEPSDK